MSTTVPTEPVQALSIRPEAPVNTRGATALAVVNVLGRAMKSMWVLDGDRMGWLAPFLGGLAFLIIGTFPPIARLGIWAIGLGLWAPLGAQLLFKATRMMSRLPRMAVGSFQSAVISERNRILSDRKSCAICSGDCQNSD